MKKLLTVLACLTALTLVSCASTETKESAAAEPEAPVMSAAKEAAMAEEGAIDLSTYSSVDAWAITYDDEAYTLTMNGGEYFQFPLPKEMNAGDVITVHVTGINNGESGFRSWVIDNNQTTNSDPIYTDSAFAGLPQGEFDITYTLNAKATSTNLFFKGPQWGTMIDKITLKSVAVIYQ